jgi:hypothetical protein
MRASLTVTAAGAPGLWKAAHELSQQRVYVAEPTSMTSDDRGRQD